MGDSNKTKIINASEHPRRTEEVLETTVKIWQDTFDAISDGVWILDTQGRIIQSNGVYERLLGIKAKDAIGQYCYKIAHCASGFIEKCPFKRMKRIGLREYAEYEDRERGLWLQITVDPICDRSGMITNAVHIVRDITENKQSEKALKESEEKYRRMVDTAQEGIWVIDEHAKTTYVNQRMAEMLGYTVDEMIGRSAYDFVGVDDKVEGNIHFDLRKQGIKEIHDFRYLRKDGSSLWTIASTNPMFNDGGNFMGSLGMFVDITDRKLAEEKILLQATLLDTARDAIAVRDMEHRLIYWNKGAERMYGWTAEEVTGKNANELLYKKESPIEAVKSVIEKGEWTGELQQVTRGGKEIIAESRWTLMRDTKGNPKSILIINTDITAKKNLEMQLLRAQRMESIGTLASGIAHDMNNVLSPMMMSLQLLKEKFSDDENRNLIDILERSAQRGASLIKQVQSFARGVEGERTELAAEQLIAEIKQMAKETFPRSIEIRTDVHRDLWGISGDATQLQQVLMNLCVNARDAMPDGGILCICAENIFIDENYARMNINAKVGPHIAIKVTDNGTGIQPEILDRIFEPFFTTKGPGKGTGLGLSIVLAIVKSHGGFINVYSEAGAGTVFKVCLPAAATTGKQETEKPEAELPAGRGEMILVVDDEASIREITRSLLETHGYRVMTACDGSEAIEMFLQNKDEIKAVVMDMMMPVMDGSASLMALSKIDPEVKIIAVSGLTESDNLADVKGSVQAFLSKPYTAEKLLRTMYEVLSC